MSGAASCPSEGVLLRRLDGELPDDVAQAVDAHLAGCAPCRGALEALGGRDRSVKAWLGRHDPPPPGRTAYDFEASPLGRRDGGGTRTRRWMAAAAIVVAVVGVAGPARGVVLDPLVRWLERAGGGPPPAAPAADGDAPAASPATSFVFEGPELLVAFAHPRTRGTLTVEPGTDSLVTIRAPHRGVDLSVGPGVLDVGNRAVAVGDYRVVVPPSLKRLRVRVEGGGEEVVDVSGLTASASRTVPLPPPSPSRGSSR